MLNLKEIVNSLGIRAYNGRYNGNYGRYIGVFYNSIPRNNT